MSEQQRLERLRRIRIWRSIGQRVASFNAGPLLWLTQYTKTEDLHWIDKDTEPVAPFPTWPYFPIVLRYILERKRVFIPKTREMMTSWLACGYVAWSMQWHPHLQWVMQSQKEDKAFELVNYIRILYRHQPAWMSDRVSVVGDNIVN